MQNCFCSLFFLKKIWLDANLWTDFGPTRTSIFFRSSLLTMLAPAGYSQIKSWFYNDIKTYVQLCNKHDIAFISKRIYASLILKMKQAFWLKTRSFYRDFTAILSKKTLKINDFCLKFKQVLKLEKLLFNYNLKNRN